MVNLFVFGFIRFPSLHHVFCYFFVVVNLLMMLWICCFDNFSNWEFLIVIVKYDNFVHGLGIFLNEFRERDTLKEEEERKKGRGGLVRL